MGATEISVVTTLAKAKDQVENLKRGVAGAIDALDAILRAAEAVKDQTVQALARTAKASFGETRGCWTRLGMNVNVWRDLDCK
ncbi:MAG: hypothetical protein ABSG32_21875 [Terriglobia bacterium]|jgi:hypothetical protein